MWVLEYARSLARCIGFLVVFAILMLVAACTQKADRVAQEIEIPLKIDTNNAAATYKQLSSLRLASADTIAGGIIRSLRRQNRYGLLREYVVGYTALFGDTGRNAAFVANERGYLYNYAAQYDSALLQFEKAADYYKSRGMQARLADTYIGLGIDYAYRGDFPKAFNCHYQALSLSEKLQDSLLIYRTRIELAVDNYYQKDYRKAIDIAKACLLYYHRVKDELMTAYAQSVLTTLFYNVEDYKTSLAYADSSLLIRRHLRADRDVAESLNNLSLAHMAMEHWDEAIDALTESLALMTKARDERQIPIIKQNLAHCVWIKGDAARAKVMLYEVIAEAHASGQKDAVANAYRKLSTLYKAEKMFDSSLYTFKKYKAWSDSMFSTEKDKAIKELSVRYETEKKEAKIAQLEVERKLNSTRQMVYFILFACIIVVATLVILLLSIRNKKKTILIEKTRLLLEMNRKDLAGFTEHIIAKNNFINELETQLEGLKAVQVAADDNNESLSQLYQFKILTEDDWRQFKIHFDKVHPGFIAVLRDRYPDLAPAEERQFLLIKLNISNKECADMLGISLPGVKKNRYRLKKRFGLTEQDDLDEFVKNFTGSDS